eukprot:CAMPEP_0172518756 /NCGR_PEP_ID=MMETSP1066-20121228/291007_1 /TAXON_ID=671091 /ORGANISM="Coscinodiscus wailesii, Strain CCMP2513" /LENGTH=174 /DNA_ID=CAMNT_0013301199 /DNA_START=156 /DNA_END=680 /DNA_ORIENTATION=-
MYGKEQSAVKETFGDLVDKDMDGNEVKMSSFKGSVLVITNVALTEALTKHYTEFSQLVDKYGTKGLKVLAFPCNQFAEEEPGTHEEILNFVQDNFQAKDKFIFFEKADVNGGNAREVFNFLKHKLPSRDGSTDISWNFAKFLVDHEGVPQTRFAPECEPFAMKESIEELLKNIP